MGNVLIELEKCLIENNAYADDKQDGCSYYYDYDNKHDINKISDIKIYTIFLIFAIFNIKIVDRA